MWSLAHQVSKNGNLLLDVGPMANGTIPPLQRARLEALGRWNAVNGAAVFDSEPLFSASCCALTHQKHEVPPPTPSY
jgi:alpha-L-fucosidase